PRRGGAGIPPHGPPRLRPGHGTLAFVRQDPPDEPVRPRHPLEQHLRLVGRLARIQAGEARDRTGPVDGGRTPRPSGRRARDMDSTATASVSAPAAAAAALLAAGALAIALTGAVPQTGFPSDTANYLDACHRVASGLVLYRDFSSPIGPAALWPTAIFARAAGASAAALGRG